MSKRNDPVYRLKYLVIGSRFQIQSVRRWQRSTIGMLEPILLKSERSDGTYGLLDERSLRQDEARQTISDFTGQNCFSLLGVNPRSSGGRPDWAQSELIRPTFYDLILGSDGGEAQELMNDWIQQMTKKERQKFTEIQQLLLAETRQLARNLSNDIGAFTWTTENNELKDGPLMICVLSLYPLMLFLTVAVMMNEEEWATKTQKVLNIQRFHPIFGAKKVMPSSWYFIKK